MLWRRQMGVIENLFRWINQTAYFLSVPFIMLLLFGAVSRNRQLAIVGAIAVVVLNIGRLISGFVNLAVIPLRDGINWKRLKKPIGRLIEPVLTIGLVGAAFIFLPSLSKGGTGKDASRHMFGFMEKLEKRVASEQEKFKEIETTSKGNQP
jgi:hypothetical protein